MTTIPLARTNYFTITYDDNVSLSISQQRSSRAQALRQVCDDYLRALAAWFNIDDATLAQDFRSIEINLPEHPQDNSGNLVESSINSGYQPTQPNSQIIINPADRYTSDCWGNIGNDGVATLLTRELAKILISYRNFQLGHTTWNPNGSDGEALAHVAMVEFHSRSYYDFIVNTATNGPLCPHGYFSRQPFVNYWFNNSLTSPPKGRLDPDKRDDWDWITKTHLFDIPWGTSTNPPKPPDNTALVSIGCAILFIYYLHSQLNIPLNAIVMDNGETLERKYQSLKGLNDGFTALNTFLNRYYPPAGDHSSSTVLLASENPFPIYNWPENNPNQRTAGCAAYLFDPKNSFIPNFNPRVNRYYSHAKICPDASTTPSGIGTGGPPVPPSGYRYTVYSYGWRLRIIAYVTGFAQPIFSWTINGQQLPDSSGAIRITSRVERDDLTQLSNPTPKYVNTPVNFNYKIIDLEDSFNSPVEAANDLVTIMKQYSESTLDYSKYLTQMLDISNCDLSNAGSCDFPGDAVDLDIQINVTEAAILNDTPTSGSCARHTLITTVEPDSQFNTDRDWCIRHKGF